jgi:hypothetical protein
VVVGLVTVAQVPTLAYVVGGAVAMTFVGVVVPAVFFRTAERRRDAGAVLSLLLELLRPRPPS